MHHVVIIGNGIAGITAARYVRKNSDFKITVVGSETEFFYARTALMYIFMGHMKFEHTKPYEDNFWSKNNIDLIYDKVENVDQNMKILSLKSSNPINYDSLVLALGSKTALFNWPGQNLKGVSGLYSLQDMEYIDQLSSTTKEAVIVGGGLIGIELAEMLHTRGIGVTIIIRENSYWQDVLPKEESLLVTRHVESHGIKILVNTELAEIQGNDRVTGIRTKDGQEIDCQIVGITTGVVPNIDLVKNIIECKRGILVDARLQTNVRDIYAVGDCAELRDPDRGRRAIEPVWYVGRMMGEIAGRIISGDPIEYQPGPWFNSAKFFDIEYQSYGLVSPELNEGETKFYWEDETGTKCIKIVFDSLTGVFIGINAFGIRLRHEIIDRWLADKAAVETILDNFEAANFDTEFYHDYSPEILHSFDSQFPGKINIKKLGKKKSWKLWL